MHVTKVLIWRGGSDAHTASMPPKRQAAESAAATTDVVSKRYKSAIDAMADEWLCPITTELPLEPVIAEDGQVYEKSALEELIRSQKGNLRSPMTNLPMGRRIVPSVQARNTIEKLVRSGAIGGDKAERWLERLSEEEMVKATVAKAEGGDAEAMFTLGDYHFYGEHGLKMDDVAANRWYKMGADLNDPRCLAAYGQNLIFGRGVSAAETHGICLMFQAAGMGSKHAASCVGHTYWKGLYGIPQDTERAKHWYRKVATAPLKDIESSDEEQAAQRLLLDGPHDEEVCHSESEYSESE
jgi:uncharacterized protein YdaT